MSPGGQLTAGDGAATATERWRRRPTCRILRAVKADEVAVRVFDFGVARPPERVERRQMTGVTGTDESLVQVIDGIPRRKRATAARSDSRLRVRATPGRTRS